jgi:6-pyruvoyltetrahydropterin/6-carboxytetrahydropterin synthase
MFEVDIVRSFSAAHCLRGYQGDCSKLHGHNWTVQAVISASELDAILDEFDHSNISEHSAFTKLNPTSENIAKTVYKMLAAKMNDDNVKVARVRVCESPGSGATYFED